MLAKCKGTLSSPEVGCIEVKFRTLVTEGWYLVPDLLAGEHYLLSHSLMDQEKKIQVWSDMALTMFQEVYWPVYLDL